ncbi:hypothetical protein RAS2_35960 [Phycisphaerae bacterium RAS2]|nr:hypothetical protein RAS2_35960 [Phycisphaerae bacterium RAS2]
MEKSTKIKAGFAAGMLGLALFLYFWMSSGAVEVPDTDDTRTHWFCTEAKKPFSLSGPESATDVRMVRRQIAGDAEAPSARRSEKVTVIQALSPFSGKYTGVPAVKCPKCGEIFEERDDQGQPRNCPKCGTDPTADEPSPDAPPESAEQE